MTQPPAGCLKRFGLRSQPRTGKRPHGHKEEVCVDVLVPAGPLANHQTRAGASGRSQQPAFWSLQLTLSCPLGAPPRLQVHRQSYCHRFSPSTSRWFGTTDNWYRLRSQQWLAPGCLQLYKVTELMKVDPGGRRKWIVQEKDGVISGLKNSAEKRGKF